MICKNCGAGLPDETSFCSKCGHDLRDNNDKNQLTMKFEIPKKTKVSHELIKKFSKIIHSSKIQISKKTKQSHKLVKKFSENIHLKNIELSKKTTRLHKLIKKLPLSINSRELIIIEGWTWGTEGNYTYLRGSVKNIGNKAINHFEVNVKYEDVNKNVLDSDFTNWDRVLQPGDCKQFEIMHHLNENYHSVDISVNDYKRFSWK